MDKVTVQPVKHPATGRTYTVNADGSPLAVFADTRLSTSQPTKLRVNFVTYVPQEDADPITARVSPQFTLEMN